MYVVCACMHVSVVCIALLHCNGLETCPICLLPMHFLLLDFNTRRRITVSSSYLLFSAEKNIMFPESANRGDMQMIFFYSIPY